MRRVRLCRAKCAPVHPVSAVHWHMFVNEGLPGWASHQRGGASSQLTTRLCWQRPASERGCPPQLPPLPGWRLPAPRWSCTGSCWKWPLQWSALCGRTQKQTNCLLSVHSPSKSMHSPLLHIEHTMQTTAAQAAPPKQKMALALTLKKCYCGIPCSQDSSGLCNWTEFPQVGCSMHLLISAANLLFRIGVAVCVHANHLNLGCTRVEVSFVNAHLWTRLFSFARFG